MFTYRCPACGKQHVVDATFLGAYDAACLRCREIVHVTQELTYAAEGSGQAQPAGKKGSRDLAERFRPAARHTAATASGPDQKASTPEGIDDPGNAQKGMEGQFADQEAARRTDFGSLPDLDLDGNGRNGKAAKGKGKKKAKNAAPTPTEVGRRRWLVIVGVSVLILGGLGTGGYFGYDYYRKHKSTPAAEASQPSKGAEKTKTVSTPTKVAAAKPKTATKTANTPPAKAVPSKATAGTAKGTNPPKAEPAKSETVEPIIKPRDDKVIRISAARLSSELATNPAATNEKYKGTLLEVSGIYEKSEARESVRPPKRPHVFFHCGGPPIIGDLLGSHTPPQQWSGLRKERPCTIRGVYGSDGVVHGCDLLPLTPPADAEFKGKDMEVTGYVAEVNAADRIQLFPRIMLETETNSILMLECLFRRDDEAKVLTVAEGMPVIVRGTCGGRYLETAGSRNLVRLNNCELVFTSTPSAERPRISSVQLLRAYEEDLRPVLMPPAATAAEGENPIPLAQLEAEFAKDPKSLARYRHRTLTVAGTAPARTAVSAELRLTTGATDAAVTVRCRFSKRTLKELDAGPNHAIRGFCSELTDPRTLVLESCESVDATGRPYARRLTADFFPHTPGLTRVYDIVQHPAAGGRPQATRTVFDQKEGGVIQSVTTHVGFLRTSSLFDPSEGPRKWISNAGVRKVRLPGPEFRHRLFGGLVELGHFEKGKEGSGGEWFFEPVLKVGAKPGDTWRWTRGNAVHEYKVVKFDSVQGQPSVVIEEIATTGQDPHHPLEVQHVYVRGHGEIERHEYMRLTAKEKRLVAEWKLVDEVKPPSGAKAEASREPVRGR